jgi:hypothetical protein
MRIKTICTTQAVSDISNITSNLEYRLHNKFFDLLKHPHTAPLTITATVPATIYIYIEYVSL